MNKLALLIVVLGFTGAAFAQQYKWVDKDGRLQYGDVPPPGVKAQRLRPPPTGGAPAPSTGAAKKDDKPLSPEAAFQKRQKEQKEADDKASKERAEADLRRGNCEAAQAALRQIQSGQRMMTMNAQGERVFLDDSARAAEEARAQKAVSENCK